MRYLPVSDGKYYFDHLCLYLCTKMHEINKVHWVVIKHNQRYFLVVPFISLERKSYFSYRPIELIELIIDEIYHSNKAEITTQKVIYWSILKWKQTLFLISTHAPDACISNKHTDAFVRVIHSKFGTYFYFKHWTDQGLRVIETLYHAIKTTDLTQGVFDLILDSDQETCRF